MKKKKSIVQIAALAAVVLLIGLYVLTLIFSLIGNALGQKLFWVSLASTFLVPVVIYIMMMFYRLSHRNAAPEDIQYADEKDDPFTEEDFK